MSKRKHRQYKTPKTILRKVLEHFEANPKNWTIGVLFRPEPEADDGVARCVLGACQYFADGTKPSNDALRHLAESMGMRNAQTARINRVRSTIYGVNDKYTSGRRDILRALKKATS
jgi:hypothetical protein